MYSNSYGSNYPPIRHQSRERGGAFSNVGRSMVTARVFASSYISGRVSKASLSTKEQ